MKTRSNWWNDLARACWAKVNTDSDDRPRIPTREQVLADLDAEYMAAARLDYRGALRDGLPYSSTLTWIPI